MNLFKKILLAPVKGVNKVTDAISDSVVKKLIMSVARHGLTALGGVLVAHGWVTGDEATDVLGAGLTLVAVLWSALEKYRQHQP